MIKAKVHPYRPGLAYGNIIWAKRDRGSSNYRVSEYAMKAGTFPLSHPVAPGPARTDRDQKGDSESLTAFRSRGYYASCFPEGDGMAWKPLHGQDEEQCFLDIRDCFPQLDLRWARK